MAGIETVVACRREFEQRCELRARLCELEQRLDELELEHRRPPNFKDICKGVTSASYEHIRPF